MKKDYIVKDYMRCDVITVSPDTTLGEALHIMLENKTNALVVVSSDNSIEGMVTSWSIIEHLVPDYLEVDKHLASFESGQMFEERVRWMKDHPVSEIMTTRVHTIGPEDSLMETATQISEHHIRQLPVVNKDGKLCGYINHTDVKRAMGEVLGVKKSLLK